MPTFPLTDDERIRYLQWVIRNNVPISNDYDMEGFWKALNQGDTRTSSSISSNDGQLHFTDMFKLPSHPSFSSESVYAKDNSPKWFGGGLLGGGESWSLYDENGNLIKSEAPWNSGNRNRYANNPFSGLLGGE